MRSLLLACVLAFGLTAFARTAEAADIRVFVRNEVGDYATWRKVYDDFGPIRKKLGVTAQEVYRSVDNPNEITITHDFKTLEKARAFVASAELKAAILKGGATGTPQIWFTTRTGK